MDTFSLKL